MSSQVEQRVGFQVGQRAGTYEFLDVLSSSTSEAAYKVRNHLTQRLEALKVLSTDAEEDRESVQRFIREIKVHARLLHPNIVTFYNAAELEGQLVMTKELVEGITLAERLRSMGSLPWMEAVSHISQILEALSFAHHQGIIHRNVTPETIIITADTTVKLNGFELAKPISSPGLTQAGSVLGALKYIPPEQIRGLGPLDARSDLYSVGVVLYEALTGRLPFDSSSQFKVMMDHVNAEPPAPSSVNPKLPPEFDSILLKALAKYPEDRFQTADEFRGQLEYVKSILRGKPAGTPAAGSIEGRACSSAEPERPAAELAAPAGPSAEAVAPETTPSAVEAGATIPSFGVAAINGAGRRRLLLLILGVCLVGVIFALLLALGKLWTARVQ